MADAEFHVHTFYADFEREQRGDERCVEVGMSVPKWFAIGKSLAFMRSPAGQRQLAIALLQDAENQQRPRFAEVRVAEVRATECPDGRVVVTHTDGQVEVMAGEQFHAKFKRD